MQALKKPAIFVNDTAYLFRNLEHGCISRRPKNLRCASAPEVIVKDTVGAGDAFMAGLVVGLTRCANTQKTLETAYCGVRLKLFKSPNLTMCSSLVF